MKFSKLSLSEKWILLGIPFLFLIGACFHFLFELSNKLTIVGTISAVNESVWEHGKMILLPVICWWSIYYAVNRNKYSININKWFTGLLIALVASLIISPVIFYFYTQAFGIQFLVIDIFILLLSFLVGQCLGLHFYRHAKGINAYISITIIVLIFISFVVFTFNPPHLPIFFDSSAGKYGI